MFTVKATYRGETRKFTFPDSTVFPSFHQIYLQLYRVFPISHNYYLSKLLFSPDSAVSKSRILLAREIHGEEDYSRAVSSHAGTKGVWANPLLKFFVYDETPHKLPALPSPFSSSYSVASTSTPVASVASTLTPGNAFGTNSLNTPVAFSLIPPPPVIFSSVTPQLHSSETTPRLRLPPRSPVSPQQELKQQTPAHVPCCEELEKIKALVFEMKAELEKIQARIDVAPATDNPPPLPAKPVPVRMGGSLTACSSCDKLLTSDRTFECDRCAAIFCPECGAGRSYFPHVECADGGYQHAVRANEPHLLPFCGQPYLSPSPPASTMSSQPTTTSIYPMLCAFKFCYKCSQLKQGHWYSCESCASNLCPQCKEQDSSQCPFGASSHGWNKKTCGHCPQSVEPNTAGISEHTLGDAFGSQSTSGIPPPPPIPTTNSFAMSPLPTPTGMVPAEAVHGGVQCDSCNILPIHGIRHKCLDCPDYDLCPDCIAAGGAEAHNLFHEFFEVKEPGRVVVHTVYSGQGEREATASVPLSPPVPEPVPVETPRHQEPILHGASCNLCDSRIRGNRYKCVECPDFDTCEGCFAITNEHHPQHTFIRVDSTEQFIRRTETDRPMHYAMCDNCQKGIFGVRYKCMHPQCPDFDLCEDCEAHPIPVHPRNHNLLKVRDPESAMPVVVRAGQAPPIPEPARCGTQFETRRTPSPSPVPPPRPRQHELLTFNHSEALPTIPRTPFPDHYMSFPSQPPVMYDTPSRIPSPVVHEREDVSSPHLPSIVKPPSPFFYPESERSISPPTADYRGQTVPVVEPPFVQPVPWRRVSSPPVLPTPPNVTGHGKEWDPEDFWKKVSSDLPAAPSPPPKRVSFPSWTTLPPLAPPLVRSVPQTFDAPQRSEAVLNDICPLPLVPGTRLDESKLAPEPEVIEIVSAAPSIPPLIPTLPHLPQMPLTPPTHNSDWETFKDKYPDWMNTWLLRFAPPTTENVELPTPAPSSVVPLTISAPSSPPLVSETATQTRILPVEEVEESRVQLPRVSALEAIEEKERFWGRRGLDHLTEGIEASKQKVEEASFEKDLLKAIQVSEQLESSSPRCASPVSMLSPSTLMGELLSQPSVPSRSSTFNLRDILNEPSEDGKDADVVLEQVKEVKSEEIVDKVSEEEPLISAFNQLSFSSPAPAPLEAKFIADRSVPDGQVFPPGAEFIKTWRLKNSGTRDWDDKTVVVWAGGDDLGKRKGPVKIGKVAAGEEVDIWTSELKAPESEGRYVGFYRLKDANGTVFGDSIWLDITVKDGAEERQDGESSDEYKSMSSSSVIVMPQAVNDTISRTSSTSIVDNGSDNGSASDTSSISLISSIDSDEEWEDSREQAPAGDADEYIVLYDDDSE